MAAIAINMTVSVRLKDWFFDRQVVRDRLEAKTHRALNHAGGYIRRVARNSMKRETAKQHAKRLATGKPPPTSPPGKPPRARSSHPTATLKNIWYGFDSGRQSLVVGPLKLNKQHRSVGPQLGSLTVPQLHEFGGSVSIREVLVNKTWFTGVTRARPGQKTRTRIAKYPARPFMGPALDEAVRSGKIPEGWRGEL